MSLDRIALTNPIEVVLAGESGGTREVLLVPDGETVMKDGTRILLDADGADSVVQAFDAHGADLPFDINHASAIKLPRGEESPAYGWGKSLSYRPGLGLFCDVEWTEEGRDHIRSGRYKYVSPVIGFEKETGRVRAVYSAAITTSPATPGMPALAATHGHPLKENNAMNLIKKMLQEDSVVATAEQKIGELKSLLEGMGVELGDGADFVSIINAALGKLKGDGDGEETDAAATTEEVQVAATVRTRLGLPATAGKDQVVRALSDLQGHVGYVPAKQHAGLVERVDVLESQAAHRAADDLVQECLTQGKLLATDDTQMKWAMDRATQDPDGFKTLMAHAPIIVPQGRMLASASPSSPRPSARENELIEKALSDHDGNQLSAMVALQTKLMTEQTSKGLTRKAARETLEGQYPKIFGVAA
jgi:phage I-like protein